MKKLYSLLVTLSLTTTLLFAQGPQKMSYQAVIRNSNYQLVCNHPIGMRISILQGSATGTTIYTEIQTPVTNANGLVSIEIGGGVGFDAIDWANGPYFIQTETDPAGETNYSITGTSQLLSVPYALHAKSAETLTGPITEADPVFVASPAAGISSTNTSNWNSAFGWGNHSNAGYLTSFTETDPVFGASPAKGITLTNTSNWNTAFGWGNHANAGYLTSFTETDPVFEASPAKGITLTNTSNWNTAFGWGNHANAGYLTSFTETDPIYGRSVASGIAETDTATWNNKQDNLTAGSGININGNTISATGMLPTGATQGEMLYWNGSAWQAVAPGEYGKTLCFCNGVPTWGGCIALLTTTSVSAISTISATVSGIITNDGGSQVIARGICWSSSANPTISNSHTSEGSGPGAFASEITGLVSGSTYFARTYATNSAGTAYGNELSFTTSTPVLPTVITAGPGPGEVSATSVGCGGIVTSDGGDPVTQRGICLSTSSNPTTSDICAYQDSGTGPFFTGISGLTPNTIYFIRAFATNSIGTAYGDEVSFTTLSNPVTIGQNFGGGVVFYVTEGGQHGLIAATVDQCTASEWGCFGTSIPGTYGFIGSGQDNTTAIVNGCSQAGIAARICAELVLNGFNDWFLPSKDELIEMYQQKELIGGFASHYYWSSSQGSINSAWAQDFSGSGSGYSVKSIPAYVRAIRAF
jgi:hypothetical protein